MQTSASAAATSDIGKTVRDYIVTNFLFDDGSSLQDDQSLLEAGALDSTGVMELVAFLEDHYGIPIRDQDLVPENLDSIERIARFVATRKTEQPNASQT